MNRFLLIAFRNVRSHWRQSLAALLSISASFFAYVTFEGYIRNVKEQYYVGYRNRSMLGDLLVENRDIYSDKGKADPWSYYLTPEDQSAISAFRERHRDAIVETVRALRYSGIISNGKASSIFLGSGYDLEAGARVRGAGWAWNAPYGLPLQKAEGSETLALGQGLGRIMGCVPEKEVFFVTRDAVYEPELRALKCANTSMQLSVTTQKGAINALDLDVVGLVDGGYQDIDKRYLNTSLEVAQRLNHSDRISIQSFLLKNESLIPRIKTAFENEVGAQRPWLHIMNWQDHVSGELYLRTMELLGIFRDFVVIVIISISSLSVFNTMVKIVKERTREIGTLQSLGFRKTEVFLVFAWEALLLTLLGSTVGMIVAILFAKGINAVGIFYKAGILSAPVPFHVDLVFDTYLEAAALLILITVSATFLACRRTLAKRIVECLYDL